MYLLSFMMLIMIVFGQTTISDSQLDPNLKCGDTNTVGETTYKLWQSTYVCLVFPNINGSPKKVLFNPKVDRFDVL